MAKGIQFLWILIIVAANPVLSQQDKFVYNGFKGLDSNNISLSGCAEIEKSGVLKLTNETIGMIGHAFYPTPIKIKSSTDGRASSFSTAFAFSIVPQYKRLGGHGFAFAISPWKELRGALPRQFLGLVNATSNENSSNHLFAVEFDTVQDLEFKDMNDNHVGIDINGLVSNYSVSAGYFVQHNSSKQELSLKNGKMIQAWIDYNSETQIVDVKLSLSSTKPSSSIISYRVDLSTILENAMFVGFSASTGMLASHHYIHGWSFNMTGEAHSLDLSSLPSLPGPKQNRRPMIAGVTVTAVSVVVIAVGIAFYIIRKMRNDDVVEDWEIDVGPHRFTYKELKQATKGFREKNLIGFGGFGRVYKGTLTLPNGKTQVAVKRISQESRQGMREFASEISTIGRLRHRHLVQLLGWCRRRSDLLLAYDYMPNGSLDKYIFDNPVKVLNWEQRLKIIKGVASGLLYLHEEWEQTVIHRDIKAGNVLLDSEMNGRLGDFGLAKLYEHGANPSTTRVVGTLGYLAPELTRTGKPTASSDVFAFGALLLEVVCGRRPIEPKSLPEELILVDWVWESWKEGAILQVVDQRLGGMYDEIEVVVVLKIGLMCSNDVPARRPSMRQVARYLEGEVELPEVVAPLDEYEGKKGGGGIGGLEFEDFVHSYPLSSSYYEKASAASSGGDGEGSTDVEAGRS